MKRILGMREIHAADWRRNLLGRERERGWELVSMAVGSAASGSVWDGGTLGVWQCKLWNTEYGAWRRMVIGRTGSAVDPSGSDLRPSGVSALSLAECRPPGKDQDCQTVGSRDRHFEQSSAE